MCIYAFFSYFNSKIYYILVREPSNSVYLPTGSKRLPYGHIFSNKPTPVYPVLYDKSEAKSNTSVSCSYSTHHLGVDMLAVTMYVVLMVNVCSIVGT